MRKYQYKQQLKDALVKAVELNLEHRNEVNKSRTKELNKQIGEAKKALGEESQPLREKQEHVKQLKKKIGEEHKEQRNKQESRRKKKLTELQKEVEEKIAKGEKLTNEDFMILQGAE